MYMNLWWIQIKPYPTLEYLGFGSVRSLFYTQSHMVLEQPLKIYFFVALLIIYMHFTDIIPVCTYKIRV